MAHIAQVGAPLVVIAALTVACGGSEESRQTELGAAAGDSAAQAAAAGPLRVSNVMIGRQVGPTNRITDPTFQFTPQDTVHLSVATEGSGEAATLTVAWRFQSGEIVQQTSESVRPQGENTAFHFSPAKGLKLGTYKAIVFLRGDSVDTKVFAVRK